MANKTPKRWWASPHPAIKKTQKQQSDSNKKSIDSEIVYSSISLNEIKAQLSVGAITKKDVPAMIKITNDANAIIWALDHESAYIRRAAVAHDLCPFGRVIKSVFMDNAKSVRNSARKALVERRQREVEQFFIVLEDFPQYSLPFVKDNLKVEDIITNEDKTLSGEDDEEDEEDKEDILF